MIAARGRYLVRDPNTRLGEAGEVFYVVDTGGQSVPDAGEGMCVRQDRQTHGTSRQDEAAEFSPVELHTEGVNADSGHPASRHHLDRIDSTLMMLSRSRDAQARQAVPSRRRTNHSSAAYGRIRAWAVAVPLRPVDVTAWSAYRGTTAEEA